LKIFYDTETCGFVGQPVLLQYRTEDDPTIHLFHFWAEPIHKTMKLIEWMMENEVVGFNLTFDHFQLCKIYTMFEAYLKAGGSPDTIPMHNIKEIAAFERAGMDGSCLKPKAACDLMLLARKGKYQITMERSDIRIKRVPTVIAWDVAKELEDRILFDPILFAKQQNKTAPKWKVRDTYEKDGRLNKHFKDIVLKFRASAGLKALAVAACNFLPEDVLSFHDVEVPKAFQPDEIEYAPFADAVRHEYARFVLKKKHKRKRFVAWPELIEYHIAHWLRDPDAQKYASNDVVYTHALWEAFDKPECGDVDSELACCVAAVRWRGYALNLPGIEALMLEAGNKRKDIPLSANRVKKYLLEGLTDLEQTALGIVKTGKVILEDIARSIEWKDHPIQQKAKNVLEARFAEDEKKLYRKLLIAGRLHFGVKVIGALSSRMSGDNKLNPQGIKRDKKVRRNFLFADRGLRGYGGDFDGFEVGIADAVYGDEKLHALLVSGEKIHTIFAMVVFPEATKEEIVASKGSSFDMYDMGKRGVFSQIYGGNANTLMTRLGLAKEIAIEAEQRWLKEYPGIARARQKIADKFSPMRQPGGLGTRIIWNDPADFVSSLLGHRRYFTLENKVCKSLFDLANKPLAKWKQYEGRVIRRERQQTIGGAVQSALYACAFAIQSAMTRQAANHEIQSTGAQITKDLQWKIWNHQPSGVGRWIVQPCNIHDEVLCPIHPDHVEAVKQTVHDCVEHHRALIPLIGMEFKQMDTWADK
jgi:hypothetical protein